MDLFLCLALESGFTGFYWVLLGFTGFYWVLLGQIQKRSLSLVSTKELVGIVSAGVDLFPCLALKSEFTEFYWVFR